MRRVLVTGGASCLGSYICENLLKKKKSVIALDMADPKRYIQEPLTMLEVDLQASLNVFKTVFNEE